jgi:hypothetical protein
MSMREKIKYVIKADGRSVPFNFGKVRATCIRAGATNKLATHVAQRVLEKIHDGTTTRQIYNMVLDALAARKENQAIGHRYRLKDAIMQMGPAGFPFENYVSEILEEYGFDVKSKRSKVKGICGIHEIDIIATTDNPKARCMIECKFHHFPGIYTGIKEALYTHARFLDLKGQFDKEMLVCNTKISGDAITYGKCIGQEILSWRYPNNKGLETMIEEKSLYPVTILGLNKRELQSLVQNDIMLTKDLLNFDSYQLSQRLSISMRRIESFQNIARQIIR